MFQNKMYGNPSPTPHPPNFNVYEIYRQFTNLGFKLYNKYTPKNSSTSFAPSGAFPGRSI